MWGGGDQIFCRLRPVFFLDLLYLAQNFDTDGPGPGKLGLSLKRTMPLLYIRSYKAYPGI